ncbi:hypothetical protein BCR32DRAFT_229549 [Anaeromyces robustus]|uniref:REM-1 domain-containing protein n=1 Tax=Anaeromyces robustus TaxID=1754192 RepID=A0A1Y1XIT8_9FUNG|nr:hypothetical protein BCR32DRAFT_229549 [Anaeromyces robustus]|eukprot:ORX85670.1 hypothetical protein BCR32DRAFT_229549 [Anaeromyces robustus]
MSLSRSNPNSFIYNSTKQRSGSDCIKNSFTNYAIVEDHSPSINCRMAETNIKQLNEQLAIQEKKKQGLENLLMTNKMTLKGPTIQINEVTSQLREIDNKINELKKEININKKILDYNREEKQVKRQSFQFDSFFPIYEVQSKKPSKLPDTDGKNEHKDIVSIKIEESIKKLEETDEDDYVQILEIQNNICRLIKMIQNENEISEIRRILLCTRKTILSRAKEVRANSIRILRYCATKREYIKMVFSMNFEIFIIRSLIKDHKNFQFDDNLEFQQSLIFIRSIIDKNNSVDLLPESIVRLIIAFAEYIDEKLRNIFILTLCELAIKNTALIAKCNGIKTLFHLLVDGPNEMAPTLTMTIVHLLDSEDTRCYIKPSVDVEMIVSTLTDSSQVTTDKQSYIKKLESSSKIILTLFQSWAGLIYLCIDNKESIRSIVHSMTYPNEELQEVLLKLLFNLFKIKLPKWYPEFISGKNLKIYSYKNGGNDLKQTILTSSKNNIFNYYLSILLMAFIESNIFEVLIHLIQQDQKVISTKAKVLVGELLDLSNRLLPISYIIDLHALPNLFTIAVDFNDEQRHEAIEAIFHIDNLRRKKEKVVIVTSDEVNYFTLWKKGLKRSIENKKIGRTQRQIEQVKLQMGMVMDDVHFRNLVNETQFTKDFSKWNWSAIKELVNGPLLNPKRLEETLGSGLLKKLLLFYKPSNHQFSDIPLKTTNSSLYTEIGCTIISLLMGNPEGVKLLLEFGPFKQISEALGELTKASNIPNSESELNLFNEKKLKTTLTSEYFNFVGVMTKTMEGNKLLEKNLIWSEIYKVINLKNRDDLIKIIIQSLDYSLDYHPRVILITVMTSGSRALRLFATKYMRQLLQEKVQNISKWGMKYLVIQLYDIDLEVCKTAVRILEEACNHSENLESVVALRPSIQHLGNIGNSLMLKFLTTSVGYNYLYELGFIEKCLTQWYEKINILYTIQLELAIEKAFSYNGTSQISHLNINGYCNDPRNKNTLPIEKLEIPPHFYGELIKSKEGSEFLRKKGHFKEFANYIRKYGMKNLNRKKLLKLKSILWAVGNIGSSMSGITFLLEEDIIKNIVEIAEKSKVLTLKGTSFYIIGMISKTSTGIEKLEEYGWNSPYLPFGKLNGICVPNHSSQFLNIPPWKYKRMFDTLKIENRYTFRNDDELSIRSLSIDGDEGNDKDLENISEEKTVDNTRGECENSTSSLSQNKQNDTNDVEKNDNIDNDNESDFQESIEIIKNINLSEEELNKSDEKSSKQIKDIPITSQKTEIKLTDTQHEILENIGNLCNHILSNSASKTLIRICRETPHEFQSVDLYIESLKMQSIYNFRLTARLFINDLFEVLTLDEKAFDRIDELGGLKINDTFDDLD